jgi:hypothetical protein
MQSSTLPKAEGAGLARAAGDKDAGRKDGGKRGRPLARADLAPLLVALAAGAICYGLFFNRSVWLSVLGFSVAPAERVMQGEVPYRDFFYNYTPGILWLNALLMKLFGATVMTINLGVFAFKLLALVALFYAARRLAPRWLALVPIALTLCWIGYKYIFGVFPTQYSTPFILLGLICVLRYDESGRPFWLTLCGAMVGAVLVFKYNVGILLFASGTAVALARELMTAAGAGLKQKVFAAVTRAAAFWLGFAVVAGAMAAYMMANNALGPMIDHFTSFVGEYGDQRAIGLPPVRLLAPSLVGIVAALAGGLLVVRAAPRLFTPYAMAVLAVYSAALIVPGRAYVLKDSATALAAYLPAALFLIAGAMMLHRPGRITGGDAGRREWWEQNGVMLIVALFALGTYLEVYPRADYYHLVRVLPPVFLLLLLIMTRAFPTLVALVGPRLASPARAAAVALAVPLVLLMLVGLHNTWRPQFDSRLRFVDRSPLSIERAQGIYVPPRQAEFIEAMVGVIQANSSPDDYIFSFAQRGTGFYFLAGRRNPTRFVWWRSVGLRREEREAALAMIDEKRPKLIILQDSLSDRRVRDRVAASYQEIAKVTDIAIYDRKP